MKNIISKIFIGLFAVSLVLTFFVSYNNVSVSAEETTKVTCPNCNGSGEVHCLVHNCNNGLVMCPKCVNGTSPIKTTCSECGGTGHSSEVVDYCHECVGECFACSGDGVCFWCSGSKLCSDCDGAGCEYCNLNPGACPNCNGSGICADCSGTGLIIENYDCSECGNEHFYYGACTNCSGTGYVHLSCTECGGDGLIECTECGGDSKITCPTCSGTKTIAYEGSVTYKVACSSCNGNSEFICDDCNGLAYCPNCDGATECSNCGGTGQCPHCNIYGHDFCTTCSAEGYVDQTKYPVVFELNEGSGTAPVETSYYMAGDQISLPAGTGLTKTGYAFVGWSTDSSSETGNTGNYTIQEADVNDPITFYAIWEDLSYGEDISLDVTKLVYGTKSSDVTVSTSNDGLKVLDYAIYKGIYSPATKVTEVNEAGNYFLVVALGFTSTEKAYYFGTIDLFGSPSYVHDLVTNFGYNGGLVACESYTLGSTLSITQASLSESYKQSFLIATVKFDGHTVSYDDNVSDDSVYNMPSEDTNTYIEGYPLTLPNNLTRDNYAFMGWNTDENATTGLSLTDGKYIFGNTDAQLYAIWKDVSPYNDEVEFSITPLTYGLEKKDIVITVSDSNLKVKDFSLLCTDSTGQYEVDKVEKNGVYQVNIIIDGKDGSYYFPNTLDQGSLYYSGGVTLGNLDEHNYTFNYSIQACDRYALDRLNVVDFISDTESWNRYLAIPFVVTGINVTYDDNVSDEVITVPTDALNIYYEGSPVTISTDIPTRFGYVFVGWNTDEYATTGLTFTDGKYTITSDDVINGGVTFYAIWKKVIVSEPSKTNDYEIKVDTSLTNVTYKWYKKIAVPVSESENIKLSAGKDNEDGSYTSVTVFVAPSIIFVPKDGVSIDITNVAVSYQFNGETSIVYGYYSKGSPRVGIANLYGDLSTQFTITDVYELVITLLNGETNSKLGSTTLEDAEYYCEVLIDGKVSARSESFSPTKISFADETGSTKVLPNDMYQLDGRDITLPTNDYIYTNHMFKGWNNDKTQTSGLVNNKYTATSADATLYAIWGSSIEAQPSKSNGYTFDLDDSITDVKYQWYYKTKTKVDFDSTKVVTESTVNNDTISSSSNTISLLVNNSMFTTDIKDYVLEVTSEKELTGYFERVGNVYTFRLGNPVVLIKLGGAFFPVDITCVEDDFTVTNARFYFCSTLENETSASFGNEIQLEDAFYFCVVNNSASSDVVAISDKIYPTAIIFDKNGADSGTDIPNMYQFDGRSITLPSSDFEKDGFKFIGWNTLSNTKTALASSYNVGSGDVTLYSVWTPTHTCDEVLYDIELDSTFTGGKLSSGNYFLSSDLYITSTITFAENAVVNICMNGYAIDCIFNEHFNVYSNMFTLFELGNGVSLTISNCNCEHIHSFSYDDSSNNEDMVADYDSEGTHKYTGGVITGVFGNAFKFKGTTDSTISLTLKNISFIGNKAGINGLINNEYPASYKTLVSISDCLFSHNGMIAAAATPGNNLNSFLNFGTSNNSYGIDMKDTLFEYNYVFTYGTFRGFVGLYSDTSTTGEKVTFDNVDFENNYIETNTSGASLFGSLIYINAINSGNYDEENNAIKLVNCDFKNNSVFARGGNSYVRGLVYSCSFLKVSDCVFDNNTLTVDDNESSTVNGGMFHQTNNLILENTIISNNTVNTTTSGSLNDGQYTGLVVAFPTEKCYALVIKDTTIINNVVNSKPSKEMPTYASNSGYYIYSGKNVCMDGLSFENNQIIVDSKIFGKDSTSYNSYSGAFIYTSSSYAVYGVSKLINENVTIKNSIFDSNSFTSNSQGSTGSYFKGGILFLNSNAFLEDVDFVNNNINTEANINGGLIFACENLEIKGKETTVGYDTVYVNSTFDNNTITNNPKNSVMGGLIYGCKATSINYVDITDNNITITNDSSLYGALIATFSDDSDKNITISNSSVKDNNVSSNYLYGLVGGHFSVFDTEFVSNHITANNVYGGILCSYWVSFFGNDSQGIYYAQRVTFEGNEFSPRSNSDGRVFGFIIYTTSPKIYYTDLVVEGNKTVGSYKYDTVFGGVICSNNSNYKNYLTIGDNVKDVKVTQNSFESKNLYGGFLYSTEHTIKSVNITFRNNTITVDNLYGGFAATAVDIFADLYIKNNTFNISEKNYANYFYCYENSTIGGMQGIVTLCNLYICGAVELYNNEFSKPFADISCWENYLGKRFVKGITINVSDLSTVTPMTYFSDMEIIKPKDLNTNNNAADVYAAKVISLYEDKYYLDLVYNETAMKDEVKIFNRFIEQPSKNNDYEYKLNEKDTEISYRWYSVLKTGDVDLDVLVNKNDLGKYLYGTFHCIGTTTQGFKFVSQSITITPTPIEAPSEDNGYKYIFDQDLINEYDVDASYQWKTKASSDSASIVILDDKTLDTVTGLFEENFTYDGFYDEDNKAWYASEGNITCITNIRVKPGERIMVDVTTLDSISEDKMIQFVLVPQEDGEETYIPDEVTSECILKLSPLDTIFSFECLGDTEELYALLLVSYDYETESVLKSNVVISKCTIADDSTYYSDDVKIYEGEEDVHTSYDKNSHMLTQGEDDYCTVFGLELAKGDIVSFEYDMSDYANIDWIKSVVAYFYYVDGFPNTLSEDDIDYDDQILYKDGTENYMYEFTTFKAPEDGYYLFMIALCDSEEYPIQLKAKIHIGQYPDYELVEGQTTNELSNVADGEYLCTATFSSPILGTISVNSLFVDYITRAVTYDANGYNITVPTDTNTYKNTQEFATLGNVSEYIVTNKYFVGWSASQDGTGEIYEVGDDVTMGKEALTLYAIFEDKELIVIDDDAQSFTYDKESQSFEVIGDITTDFTVYYYVGETWTTTGPVNVGSYNVKVTRAEDSDNQSFEKVIENGLVITKATYDMSNAKWDYEESFVYNGSAKTVSVTGLPAGVTADYLGNSQTNAGTYVAAATLIYDEVNYNAISINALSWEIIKATYDMSNAKWDYEESFVYNGSLQTVLLTGLPEGVTASYLGNAQTNAGSYVASATLIYDEANYNAISIDTLSWEIKAIEVTPEVDEGEKPEVIIGTPDGVSTNVIVEVVVTLETEVETKISDNTISDYYNLINEAKLLENEKVGVVFDVKLFQVIDGVKTPMEVSDIAPDATIVVRMLIPENVDIDRVTRILHVHSSDDIESIVFDKTKIVDGYYEITVNRLSEFAFIYEVKAENEVNWLLIAIIAGSILLFLIIVFFGMYLIWKDEVKKAENEGTLDERKLQFLDPIYTHFYTPVEKNTKENRKQ